MTRSSLEIDAPRAKSWYEIVCAHIMLAPIESSPLARCFRSLGSWRIYVCISKAKMWANFAQVVTTMVEPRTGCKSYFEITKIIQLSTNWFCQKLQRMSKIWTTIIKSFFLVLDEWKKYGKPSYTHWEQVKFEPSREHNLMKWA